MEELTPHKNDQENNNFLEDVPDSAAEQDPEKALVDDPREEFTKKAALTITVHSWATPIVGLVMLFAGLLAGFYGRPLVVEDSSPAPTEVAAQPDPVADSASSSEPVDTEAIMAAVHPKVRHFKGSPDAPITLVEFSDFL